MKEKLDVYGGGGGGGTFWGGSGGGGGSSVDEVDKGWENAISDNVLLQPLTWFISPFALIPIFCEVCTPKLMSCCMWLTIFVRALGVEAMIGVEHVEAVQADIACLALPW